MESKTPRGRGGTVFSRSARPRLAEKSRYRHRFGISCGNDFKGATVYIVARPVPSNDIPPAGGIWFHAKRPCTRETSRSIYFLLISCRDSDPPGGRGLGSAGTERQGRGRLEGGARERENKNRGRGAETFPVGLLGFRPTKTKRSFVSTLNFLRRARIPEQDITSTRSYSVKEYRGIAVN